MDWTQRLNAALDYLEETWNSEPDLERAAGLANCSLFHFLRMFEVVSGLSPGEYSRRRRLSRAAIDLAAGDDKVIDVALRYGYETPEAFAKAFKRLFGLTPTEARAPEAILQTWPPLRLAVVLKGGQPLPYRIVNRAAFTAVGWSYRVSTVGGENMRVIPEFWNQFNSDGRDSALNPLCGPLGYLGVCAEMDPKTETFTYLIGTDQIPGLAYPEGTSTIAVPAATYVVFSAIGAMPDPIQKAWIAAFSEWFPASDYEHGGTPDFEVYPVFAADDPRGHPDSPQFVSEVWIPLKKRAP